MTKEPGRVIPRQESFSQFPTASSFDAELPIYLTVNDHQDRERIFTLRAKPLAREGVLYFHEIDLNIPDEEGRHWLIPLDQISSAYYELIDPL